MKIKIKKNVIARIDGRSVRCTVGDVLEVSKNDGENLIGGGYATLDRTAAKVNTIPKAKALNSKSIKGK